MRRCTVLGAFTAVMLLLATAAYAQTFTATIRGTVLDPTGAVIPGAAVTVTQETTGLTRSMTAGASGEFDFPTLPVGTYRIEAKHPGFRDAIQTGLALHLNDIAVVNVKMQVGTAAEVMQIEASAVAVETQSGAVTGLVQGEQVRELPLNGRSFMQLTLLMPGVSVYNPFNTKDKGLLGGADLSISGSRTTGNQWLVDGANNNDVGSNRTILMYPSIDSIEEFKINRNSYGPQFGGAAGGVVNVITRSGGNDVHGSVYYFGRNDALNATDFFLKRATPAIPKQKLRRNDFGWSVGGPIKKDRVFFFWSEEWNREIRGVPRTALVPTAAELTGDFSGATSFGVLSDGSPGGSLWLPDGTWSNHFTTFQSLGITPSSAGLLYLKMFPAANIVPTAGNPAPWPNWVSSLNAPIFWREDNVRGDIRITKKNNLMLRYAQNSWDNQKHQAGQSWADNDMGVVDSAWNQPSRMLIGKLTTNLSNTAINDFEVSWSHNNIDVVDAGSNPGLKQQITQALPPFFGVSQKTSGNDLGAPVFWGAGGYGPGHTLSQLAPWHNSMDLIQFKDDFSKVWGRHSLSFGFLYTTNRKNELSDSTQGESVQIWGTEGALTYDTSGTPTGVNWMATGNWAANMLWPTMIWGADEPNHTNMGKVRWHDLEFYVGDNWRVTPRLTVEYGIRWSLYREPYLEDNRMSSFDPNTFVKGDPSPCNGLLFAPGTSFCKDALVAGSVGTAFSSRSLKYNDNNAIAPRFGIAWDPTGTGKMAIRAGVGQFFQREPVGYTLNLMGNAPFLTWKSGGRLLGTPAQLFAGQYAPAGPPCGGSTDTWCGRPTLGVDYRALMPNNWQYNLTVERELFRGSKLEIAYVGSRGVHLRNGIDLNQVAPADRYQYVIKSFQDWSGAERAKFRQYSVPGSSVADHGIFWFGRGGTSDYHSLQAMFSGKVGNTIMWQAAYTWSKLLSDDPLTDSGSPTWSGGVLSDNTDPRYDRGYSDLHRPHMFSVNLVYHLPKLASANGFVKHALGNWEIGTITSATSGRSYTVRDYRIEAGTGNTNNARPNRVPGISCYGGSSDPAQILNPAAFTDVGRVIGTLGDSYRGECLGPKTVNTDFAFYKNFPGLFKGKLLREGMNVQFRFEFFNLFNHTNFKEINTDYSLRSVTYDNGSGDLVHNGVNATKIVAAPVVNSFGLARSDLGPREIQYSIKFTF